MTAAQARLLIETLLRTGDNVRADALGRALLGEQLPHEQRYLARLFERERNCTSGARRIKQLAELEAVVLDGGTSAELDAVDDLEAWAEECCVREAGARESAAALLDSFITWAEHNECFERHAIHSARSPAWAKTLRTLELAPFKSGSKRGWQGLRLLP